MLNAYEQHLLASCLVNAASSRHHRDPQASPLAEWVADKANRIARGRRNRRRFRRQWEDEERDEGMSASELRALQDTLRAALAATGRPRGGRATSRLRRLGRSPGLTRSDFAILELLLRSPGAPSGAKRCAGRVLRDARRRSARGGSAQDRLVRGP